VSSFTLTPIAPIAGFGSGFACMVPKIARRPSLGPNPTEMCYMVETAIGNVTNGWPNSSRYCATSRATVACLRRYGAG
jgi:hypothetical protein